MRKRKIALLLVIIIFVTSLAFFRVFPKGTTFLAKDSNFAFSIKADLPFNITHNDDFTLYQTGGDGNQSTPWILENFVINASGTGWHGIYIENTTDYFILRNSTISGASAAGLAGIHLSNVTNGYLENNTVLNNLNGIYLVQAKDNWLINNTATTNNYGFWLYNSSYNSLSINNASNNLRGISLELFCYNNTLTNNTANENTQYGIVLQNFCDQNTLTGNTANGHVNAFGIYLWGRCNANNLTGNTANGNYGGIHLYDRCDGNTLTNNIATNNDDGIYLWDQCDGNKLTNNTANDNSGVGILLETGCVGNTLVNNVAKNNSIGFYVFGDSDGNTLTNNTANNNSYGILISSFSDLCTLTNNTVNGNSQVGIYLHDFDHDLFNNTASNNGEHGIHLRGTWGCNLTNNAANNNMIYGIFLEGAWNSNITGNVLVDNMKGIWELGGSGNLIPFHPFWQDRPADRLSPISIHRTEEIGAYIIQGNGSASNPYIIENFYINASGLGVHGISLQHTAFYFIMRYCVITSADLGHIGVFLDNVTNVNMTDNIINNNTGIGVSVTGDSNQFFNNTLSFNEGFGVSVTGDSNDFFNNTISFNEGFGVNIIGDSNYFERNLIYNNSDGLVIHQVFDVGTNNTWFRNIFDEFLDFDRDGLSDIDELLTYGTNSERSDTDDDGFIDGIEVASGTDPLDPNDYPTQPPVPAPFDLTDLLLLVGLGLAVLVALASIAFNLYLFLQIRKVEKGPSKVPSSKKKRPPKAKPAEKSP